METVEMRISIPIKDIFGPIGQVDPEGTRVLLEWFISHGKDGKGIAVMHDLGTDSLSLCPDFRDRVMSWRPADEEQDSYQLRELPDEDKFRAYLRGDAFFHIQMGMIYTQREWASILEANDPRLV